MLATLHCVLAFQAPPVVLRSPAAARGRQLFAMMEEVDTAAQTQLPIVWSVNSAGYKFIDDVVGDGDVPEEKQVVKLHYTVTILDSGTILGTSRNGMPLTFTLGSDVELWNEAVEGMKIGGKRRLIIPPSAIPTSQQPNVPGVERSLRVDCELVGIERGPMALLASALPPRGRRLPIMRTLWLLSFVPYFLPTEMQPAWYHDGKPLPTKEEKVERARLASSSRYLGADVRQLNDLFPPENVP